MKCARVARMVMQDSRRGPEGEENISFVKGHPAYAGDASEEPKDGGLEIEIQLTPREAGEHLAMVASDLVRQGYATDDRAGRLEAFAEAARRRPDLAEVYEGLADSVSVIEGPRNQIAPLAEPDFLPVRQRYEKRLADWPGVAAIRAATSNRELVTAISEAAFATTGDRSHFGRVLLKEDPQLRAVYVRS